MIKRIRKVLKHALPLTCYCKFKKKYWQYYAFNEKTCKMQVFSYHLFSSFTRTDGFV